MSETKLKPCPFCGGEARIICGTEATTDSMGRKWAYTVVCDSCCATSGLCYSVDMMKKTWNTRKPVDDVLERLEDMITFAENMPPVRDEYSAISYEKSENFIEAYKDAIEIVKEVMGYD